MNCNDVRNLLDGYIDGELDLVRTLEIEQHLSNCPPCTEAYENLKTLRTTLRAGSLYFTPPATLQKRISSAIRTEDKVRRPVPMLSWRWASIAAVFVVAVVAVAGLAHILSTSSPDDLLSQEVIASHVRSLMANHLSDVISTDQHTVKPWFDGKLDFSPPVENFADQGFPLVGGRLDYLDNRPVAALVYNSQKHIINVFIWPSNGANSPTRMFTQQGYYAYTWTKNGMMYWAVSDVNTTELQGLVQLLQKTVALVPSSPLS